MIESLRASVPAVQQLVSKNAVAGVAAALPVDSVAVL